MQKYQTMITSKYVPDWTVANGIREYIANALDSPATFEYQVCSGELRLTSTNTKLSASCLTLGTSGNRSNKDAVGTHGEGILIGLVPILREGGSVTFLNGDVVWTTSFEWDERLQVEVLTITETPATTYQDYTVVIRTEDCHIQEAVDNCLYLQEDLGHVWYGTRGRVFNGTQGKLYVGGLYVCEIKGAKYSYDFKPQYLPLNRDRKTPEFWDINKNTSELLKEVFPAEDVVDMVLERAADVSYMEYHSDNGIQEACFDKFVADYGESAVAAESYEEQWKLKAKGLTAVLLPNSNYEAILRKSSSYQTHSKELLDNVEVKEDNDLSPVEMLEEFLEEHAQELDGYIEEVFSALIDKFRTKGVRWDV